MFLLVFVEINKFSAAGMHFLELVRCSNLTFASVLRIQDVFIPDLGSYMKSGMQTYFFLASYGFRSKVLTHNCRTVRKRTIELYQLLETYFLIFCSATFTTRKVPYTSWLWLLLDSSQEMSKEHQLRVAAKCKFLYPHN
jgi:hypothetical protein